MSERVSFPTGSQQEGFNPESTGTHYSDETYTRGTSGYNDRSPMTAEERAALEEDFAKQESRNAADRAAAEEEVLEDTEDIALLADEEEVEEAAISALSLGGFLTAFLEAIPALALAVTTAMMVEELIKLAQDLNKANSYGPPRPVGGPAVVRPTIDPTPRPKFDIYGAGANQIFLGRRRRRRK